jgi:hypothetical protein
MPFDKFDHKKKAYLNKQLKKRERKMKYYKFYLFMEKIKKLIKSVL